MSRSYKKVSMYRCNRSKYFKRLVHRRNRVALLSGRYDVSQKQYRNMVSSYDICDFIWVIWPRDVREKDMWIGVNVMTYLRGYRK